MESPKEKNSTHSTPDQAPSDQDKKSFMKFYALAFELVVLNMALILGGYFLDDYLNSSPAAVLVGTFAAMAGTIWLLIKSTK